MNAEEAKKAYANNGAGGRGEVWLLPPEGSQQEEQPMKSHVPRVEIVLAVGSLIVLAQLLLVVWTVVI